MISSALSHNLDTFLRTLQVPDDGSFSGILEELNCAARAGDWPQAVCEKNPIVLREISGWRVTGTIISPIGPRPYPMMAYFHGGAWRYGNATTHRRIGHELAARGFLVLMVDYRLAPKHRFPAPVDDCDFAIDWLLQRGPEYGGDSARLVVGGDSAGAHLAAATCIARAHRNAAGIGAAILFYGIFEYHRALTVLGSVLRHGTNQRQPLVPDEMLEQMRGDPLLNPIYGAHELPPCFVLCGDGDPLLNQSIEMVNCLEESTIDCELCLVPGAPHSYFQLPAIYDCARHYDMAIRFVNKQLASR